ncbi:MAG: PLP-dependent aminotransferase family protein [Desulfotalea sp.]
MKIPINRERKKPVYQQIEKFIREAIESGTFKVNTKLPSMRSLASTLSVNRITVEMAYQQLEADGLIEKKVGSGTFVLPLHNFQNRSAEQEQNEWPLWQQGPLSRIRQNFSSLKSKSLILHKDSEPINFAGGIGDPDLFPINEFSKILQKVIKRDGVIGLSYGEPNGYFPLRNTICQIMTSLGTKTQPENILITTGSQQAINLVVQLLLNTGDVVITENPTYSGASDLFKAMNVKQVGAPMDEEGMRIDTLETMIQQHHPKLIYTIPNFHNPTGISMSGQRRRQLLALAEKYNIPILEDDYVGDLRYEGCGQPTLKSLDKGGRVIYASTFSKMLMPDLRIGFVIAEGPVYDCLVNLKCLNDIATSNLSQRALELYLSIGRYQSHLRKTVRIYRKRRDCMVSAIDKYLAGRVRFSVPKGGLYIWLEILEEVDQKALLQCSSEAGFSCFSSFELRTDSFFADNFMRLNFAYQSEEGIKEGIRRLGDVLTGISMLKNK